MTYTTLISADALKNFNGELRIFDCSADLSQPHAGREQFEAQHIAGAGFADIHTDLSSHDPALAVNGGRHPLPSREHFAAWLGRMGVGHHKQVVVYDRQGMNFCGRLWWMLQWCGHEAVAVLDGGLQAWVAVGGQVESGASVAAPARVFELRPSLVTLLHTSDVYASLGKPTQTILEARAPARFRGETEPFDPVAGHIPGALNRPF
ncbi:MAG: sulfurtransferase, partial [Burkholderiales bacterium]